MFSPIWGKGNGRGISGFAVNRGAVNRGFTVPINIARLLLGILKYIKVYLNVGFPDFGAIYFNLL